MDKNPLSKIYNTIRYLRIVRHKKRQEFLVSLIEGIIKSRSVVFSEVAYGMDKDIKISSVERRIQDFFQKVNFDYLQLMRFFLGFIHHERLTLSIDRTEWNYGKTQVNILCIVASIGKMAVPLYFEMLDNNSGNSHTTDRIALLEKIIQGIGKQRIEMLIMDREFIGSNWLLWLKKEKIPFCVRVPKSHKITFKDGRCMTVKQWLGNRQSRNAKDVCVDSVVVNVSVSYGEDQELLYLIGTEKPQILKKIYKKRWPIEVFFEAMKSRGFDLEESSLRCIDKYRKLFAVVSIAYTICWATGIQEGRKNPVKVKKHGYPQYSVFRRGLNQIREYFKRKIAASFWETIEAAIIRINCHLKTVG